jgi:hypothetical protein
MTASLLEVREGIASVLRGIDGLDTVYAYRHGSPTPPCATVGWPALYTPQLYLGGGDSWEAVVPVQVLVSMGANDSADRNMSAFLDATGGSSIVARFDDHSDLDGVLPHGYAIVRNVTDIGVAQFADDGVQYLAATFNIEVTSS